jgi:hypothetical protein
LREHNRTILSTHADTIDKMFLTARDRITMEAGYFPHAVKLGRVAQPNELDLS